MGNKQAQRRTSARRAATFLAALGALVMSSGVALMVMAAPANAVAGPSVCHPVNGEGELGNGWNLIPPDQASSHIDEAQYPDGDYWKHTSNDGRHDEYAVDGKCPGGSEQPETCPEDSTANAGEVIPEGESAETFCTAEEQPETCPEDSTANAGEVIPEGENAETFCTAEEPPATCPDDSTANAGQVIPEGENAEAFCTAVVSPPVDNPQVESEVVVSPPKAKTPKAHAATVTPTVVEAGLSGTTQDLRGEQGLALMVAGMVMLVGAGGLGLRVRSAAARS